MLLWGSKLVRLLAFVVTATLLSYSASSHAQYRSDSDDLALLFCSYVQANDSVGFRNTLRNMRLRLRDIYPRIRCNNHSMVQFAHLSDAYDIGRFIAHSVLVDDLKSSGDIAWANSVQTSNPIAEVVRERKHDTQTQ